MSGPLSRAEIIVTGKVQGVFYRVSAREVANSFSLKGWTKNSSDGSVHIIVEGPSQFIDEFIQWCNKGPSQAKINKVNVSIKEYQGEFSSFEVL